MLTYKQLEKPWKRGRKKNNLFNFFFCYRLLQIDHGVTLCCETSVNISQTRDFWNTIWKVLYTKDMRHLFIPDKSLEAFMLKYLKLNTTGNKEATLRNWMVSSHILLNSFLSWAGCPCPGLPWVKHCRRHLKYHCCLTDSPGSFS